MLHELEEIFHLVVEYGILIVEVIGALVILVAALKALVGMVSKKHGFRIELAEGISTALSFLLCGEALKTIIAPNWQVIGMTAAILGMRAAMSVLLHWETTNEKKEEQEHHAHEK